MDAIVSGLCHNAISLFCYHCIEIAKINTRNYFNTECVCDIDYILISTIILLVYRVHECKTAKLFYPR